jgi:hypothetical protein
MRGWIDHPFTPVQLAALLSIAGWLVWGSLVYSLGGEILGRLGLYQMPRLTPLSPLQGIAAGVVGASVVAAPAAHAARAPHLVSESPLQTPVPRVAAAPAAIDSGSVYVAQRGDWVSAIAGRLLGDADAYPKLFALNPSLSVDGSRHIEEGRTIHLPDDARDDGIRVHAAGRLERSARHATTSASTVEAFPFASRTRDSTPPAKAVDDTDGDGDPDVTVALGAPGSMADAGLLAAMLFALLTAERRRQRGLPATGQQSSRRADGRAERELLAAQQPADVERLDAALRNLAAGLTGRAVVPDIIGVRMVGSDVQVLLAEPDQNPPAPWLDEGHQWALPAFINVTATPPLPALLPMLVTVGSRAGRHLNIDLERIGALTIGGHPDRARDLLRHIACELACSAWSDDTTVVLAGFGDEADALTAISPDRIVVSESVGAGIGVIQLELARRAAGAATDVPTVLLRANPDATSRTALSVLQQDLTAAGRCGIAIVTTTGDAAAVGAAGVSVAGNGLLRVEVPGLRLTTDAAALPADMLEPLAAVFRVARQAPIGPDARPELPAWDDSIDPTHGALAVFGSGPVPVGADPTTDRTDAPEPLDEDLAAWYDKDSRRPKLGILGPVEVRMPGPLNDSRHRLYTEILLYLLTRPTQSATRAAIEDALWYGNPAGAGTIRNAISKLRLWLGPRADGTEWIGNASDDGEYHLLGGVLFDWHLVLALSRRGTRRGGANGMADLRSALALIRGVPMNRQRDGGPYRRAYTWIGDSDINTRRILAVVAGIAHHVAQYHLQLGDSATARWAVDRAWLVDPERSFDELWHDRMQADHHAGDTIAVQQLVHEYLAANGAEVPEDLPPPVYNRIRAILPTA